MWPVWVVAGALAVAIYAATIRFGTEPDHPSNSPVAGYVVFIAAPVLATFGIERTWFRLGRAVRRPLATIALSEPWHSSSTPSARSSRCFSP
jgi:hypothetical protein